jgi:isoleucyl-tRNA synthetase
VPFISEAIYQNLVRSIDANAPESVHLTDYPVMDESLIDADLARDMNAVLEVVKLGRAARSEANVKTRQPLPAVLVYSREPGVMDAVTRLKDQVTDELNVKDVQPLTDPGDVLSYTIRPKLNRLGPRFGKRMGELRALLEKEDPTSVAQRADAGEPVVLTFADGTTAELEQEDLLIDLTKRAGYAAAQGAIGTVALDTALTPELLQEGLARDFVRGVQDSRKKAGYQIDDRIRISVVADPEAIAALEAFESYIKTETLADTIETWSATGASDQIEASVNDEPDSFEAYEDQIEAGHHNVQIRLTRV